MADTPEPPSNSVTEDAARSSLETAQIQWEMDKLNAKRRLVDEVVQLVQHDRAINASVSRLVETMAIHSERDPAAFWRDRSASASITAQGRFQFPFPPIPPFPFPPFGSPIPPPPLPFPFPPPPPPPWDVFGQVTDLIKSEKAMIQDLVTKLLT